VSAVAGGGLRNLIAKPIMDKYGIPVVGTFNVSAALFWGHNAGDCAHHCLWSAPEVWLHSVYMRIRLETGGLKGEVPPVTVLPRSDAQFYRGEARWSLSRPGS
jgi:hypothetical protein